MTTIQAVVTFYCLVMVLFMLTLGWSVLEGIGTAMVLPAIAAVIAGTRVTVERSRTRCSLPLRRLGPTKRQPLPLLTTTDRLRSKR
ncbi:MAG: hypothetical protein LH630_04270 [Actinomycetia bacterium]|nr:hypothetical protein [Actinomycetes bacterium]